MIKILLMEDNPVEVILFKNAIRELDFSIEVCEVQGSKDIIEYLHLPEATSGEVFYLVLLDLNGTNESGFEVIEKIKPHNLNDSTPIVFLTGSSSDINICKAYELGANAYLIKPVDFDEIINMMDRMIRFFFCLTPNPSN